MPANSNPNLFRLSLPEWLKEQVDSGKHKGVYWIDRKEKIFHVPWKHASRNGWVDGDVSLFKAWAIYTNRYREGIDKARPALWKTNFRCAINSHNYISFMKDQGQRKGDTAHRIMKLVDYKEDAAETSRVKRVRITTPHPGDHPKRIRSTYPKTYCNKTEQKYGSEPPCNKPKELFLPNYSHILKTHSSSFSKDRPNLEDLYFIGKALQSLDNPDICANVSVKTESCDSPCEEKPALTVDSKGILNENNQGIMNIANSVYILPKKYDNDSFSKSVNGNDDDEKDGNSSNNEGDDDDDADDDDEDDDDLITPRLP